LPEPSKSGKSGSKDFSSDRICLTPHANLAGMTTRYTTEETLETLIATFGAANAIARATWRDAVKELRFSEIPEASFHGPGTAEVGAPQAAKQ
jgi:hypothetical protein